MNTNRRPRLRPAAAVAVAALAVNGTALADQALAPSQSPVLVAASPMEEVVVTGRYRSAATDIVSQRLDSDVALDLLDSESISRLGDSNVASALRRVPGITVRADKFVYVRGLGERYSSTQLNGAAVPSPDLTRDVLPLDIFPAEIIDALVVTKTYSPDLPAAFGGGNVDIRTTRVPEEATFVVKLKTGWNSQSSSDGWTYNGGGDDSWGEDDGTRALSQKLLDGLATYQGTLSPTGILTVLNRAGTLPIPTLEDADQINRQLATELNRNVDLKSMDMDPDFEGQMTGGYRWFIGDDLEVGVMALGSYETDQRNRDRVLRRVVDPDTNYAKSERTIDSVSWSGSFNLGVRYTDDHEIGAFSMALRNTEDEAATTATCVEGQFNDCGSSTNPTRGSLYNIRYEERDLRVNQVSGTHKLGDATLSMLPDWLNFLERAHDTEISWYYSNSTAESDIPNEVRYGLVEFLDPITGAVSSSRVRPTASAGEYRYSDLKDDVESYGGDLTVPQNWGKWVLSLSGGYDYTRKGREYNQYSFGIGSTSPGFQAVSAGTPSEVFSDANVLDLDTGIRITSGIGGTGLESYLAGQITDAGYFKFDARWNSTWRFSGGARWENFEQLSVPVDLTEYVGSRVPISPEELAQSAINQDDWYPALGVTYIKPGFWSDEFQLRLAWSQTVARPDLREISRSTYIDPITEAQVRGNPFLKPSDLSNYDLRGEWYWDSGDNLTVSLFLKDISDPIESVQGASTEDNVVFGFANGDSAEVYGVELEGLKSLDFLEQWVGDWVNGFYFSGNLTLSDSEIKIEPGGNVGNITHDKRRLTQHSEWVTNLQLGYDAPNGRHGATLAYNVFGERILFAGIDGFDDAFEQPFHSLDLIYSYFPSDQLTLKLRLQNLLDEKQEVEQNGVRIIEQDMGMTWLFDVTWAL